MRLDRRPLLATSRDTGMFLRPPVADRLLRSLDLGLNVVITGARGAGKTTLLNWVALHRYQQQELEAGEPAEEEVLRVSAAGLASPADVLGRVLVSLGDERTRDEFDVLVLVDRVKSVVSASPAQLVVALDDASAEIMRGLFGSLRDEVWATGLTWLVATTPGDAETALRPPVDAFFETVLHLAPLSPEAGADLLLRRLSTSGTSASITPAQARSIVRAAGGNPRSAIDFARAVVMDRMPVKVIVDNARHRAEALEGLSRGAALLAAELDARGPLSSSDAELQRRLGLSRPRILQLLDELDDAGLVTEFLAAPSGPGRPRTLYRLVSPTDPDPAKARP